MSDAASEPVAAPATASASGELTKDDKTWGMLAHLSVFSGVLVPFGGIIAPIVIWKTKGNESEFVADQAKEVLNFQITVFIAAVISLVLVLIMIGFVLLLVVAVASLILTIIGALKANEGVKYRYPFAIRLIK